jgi:hypothetical protein
MSLPQLSLRIREKKISETTQRLKRKEEELTQREAKVTEREQAVH